MTDLTPDISDAIATFIDAQLNGLITFCLNLENNEEILKSIEQVRTDFQEAVQKSQYVSERSTQVWNDPADFKKGTTSARQLKIFNGDGKRLDVQRDTKFKDIIPYIGKQVGDQNMVEKSVLTIRRTVIDSNLKLGDLGIYNGDTLTVEPIKISRSKAVLILASPYNAHPPIRITYSPAVLGRSDKSDINISALLHTESVNSLSRQQVKFIEDGGTWTVRLHENASMTAVYLNKQPLSVDSSMELTEGAMLSFGFDLNQPMLELYVKFE